MRNKLFIYHSTIPSYSGDILLFPLFMKAAENDIYFNKPSPYIQEVPTDKYNKKSKRGSFKNTLLNNNDLIIMVISLISIANIVLNDISSNLLEFFSSLDFQVIND